MILDSSGNVLRRIDPVDVSLDLQLEPLSSAEIELKPGDTITERSWVSVYTEHGLAGIFRSRPQRDRYGERSSRVSLVHGACELNDYLTTKGGDQEQDPASTAIAYIMQFYLGTHWRLGTVSATSSVVYQLNGSGVLDAITEIMEQLPGYMLVFDQSVTPWTLNVLPRPETVSAEGRLSRNISSVEISRDDTSLCTRVYYGENDLFVEDAAAIQKYGVIEYRINDSGLTNAQLATIAQAYLDNHKTSKLSVSISAIDFYNVTGEPIDRITLGSKYRLAIPDAEAEENRVIEAIICSIRYDSVFSNNPQITLASDPDTIITFLKMQRRSGGSARQIAKEEADKQYQHWVTENDVYKRSVYKIMGVMYDENGNVIYQTDPVTGEVIVDEAGNPVPVYNEESDGSIAGQVTESATSLETLYTKTGVRTLPSGETSIVSYTSKAKQTADSIKSEVEAARDGQTSLKSRIDQEANKIGLFVELKNGQYVIKRAGIIAAINEDGTSTTTISADKIDLEGYVTADQIFATDTTIGQYLTANNAIFQTKVKTAALEATNGATIESGLEVSDGSTLTGGVTVDSLTVGYPASSGYNLTKTILGGMVKDITLNSTTNVLTITKFNGDIINFSKAASPGNLTGSWSGAVYTVTNGSQNWTIDFDPTAASDATWATEIGTGTVSQTNSKWLDFPLYIGSYSQGGQMTHNVTISKSINATAVYTAGQDSVVSTFNTATSIPSGVTATDLLKGTVRRYHVTKDGTDIVDSYFRVPNYSATLTPASTSGTKQTLSDGVYGLYVTKDGAAEQTPIAYYEVSGSGSGGGTRTARQLLTPGGEDTITLAATDTETSSHNLVAYYTSGTDTTTLPIKIDAKEVYDAGVTAGLGGVVNVVKQPWAGNTCEFRPSAGTGSSASVTITAEATKVAPASATETGEIVLKDGDNQITTKNLYLRPRTLDGQSYIVLTDTSSIVSMGNILAKYSASGGGSESSVYAIVQNGTITYSSDYQTAFVPVAAKDENGTTLLSSSIAADISDAWQNGYTEGLTDGSGMEVQDTKDIRSNPITSNNSDIRIDPDGSALAMGHVRLAVNVPQEITDVALFRSNDSVYTYNTWSGYTIDQLTTKYAQLSIAQANGTNAYVKIDASEVYERGVAAGADTAGYRLTTVELAGTPNYFRSINVPTGTTTVNAVTGSGALYQVNSNGSLYLCSVEVSRTVQGYLYQNNGSGFERVPGTGNGSWFYVDGNVTRLMRASNLKVAAASTTQYTVATGSRQAYVTDSSGTIELYTKGATVSDTYYIKTN